MSYKEELEEAYAIRKDPEPSEVSKPEPTRARCDRCGRVVEGRDNVTAIAIGDEHAFFKYYGDIPVRTTALLCKTCNGYLESCSGSEHNRAMLECFCEFPKEISKTVRGMFEEKDILWVLERMQFVLRGLSKGEHLTHDSCVRDIFTDGGYKCPIGVDKANASSCNKCMLNWLREGRKK